MFLEFLLSTYPDNSKIKNFRAIYSFAPVSKLLAATKVFAALATTLGAAKVFETSAKNEIGRLATT